LELVEVVQWIPDHFAENELTAGPDEITNDRDNEVGEREAEKIAEDHIVRLGCVSLKIGSVRCECCAVCCSEHEETDENPRAR